MSTSELQCLEDIEWYHPHSDRHYAEGLLMQNGQEGSYLLRPGRSENTYSLSVRGQSSVKHYTVEQNGSEYHFGMATFSNLKEFVDHFASQPIVAGESGVVTLLKYPYPRVVAEPAQYDAIKVHAQMGRPVTRITSGPDLSVAAKEGFLTKQGGFVKNWKHRWFVLKKNELSYYRSRTDEEPVRTLSLQQCEDCLFDVSNGQDNCFMLVFPGRTFYLRATSAVDAKDWVDLIRWKLDRLNTQSS